ncbi:MAG: ligand-binding sensor domain-containing protein, partial [Limisphaerales bacterium]
MLANNFGLPEVRQFSREAYQAGTQNWEIIQHSNGIIYTANNEGVLEYDGNVWLLYPLPNRTLVRSVLEGPDGKIYAGGQGEFGYFDIQPNGRLKFFSLIELIPEEDQLFGDVWNISIVNDQIWFRASEKIYKGNLQGISRTPSYCEFDYMDSPDGKEVIANCRRRGMVKWNGQDWEPIFEFEQPFKQVRQVIALSDGKWVIASNKDGLWIWDGNVLEPFAEDYSDYWSTSRIYDAALTRDNNLAIATSSGGLVILSEQGVPIYKLTKSDGLQNNNILSILSDQHGDLWLGLDNGIDHVEFSSPISKFSPDGELGGVAYSMAFHDGYAWFATNNGLFRILWQGYVDPFRPESFEYVSNTRGQVWKIREVDNKLYLGHHEGAFAISGKSAEQLTDEHGTWDFLLWPGREDLMVGGSYNGLLLFKKINDSWVFQEKLPGLDQSSRIMAPDPQGWIWVTHPYRGVWKCMLSEDNKLTTRFYDEQDGFPSNLD